MPRLSSLVTASVWLVLGILSLSTSASAQSIPEPAPGLRIPDGSRPYALDVFHGHKQLVPAHSSSVQMNNHKGGNLAGGLLAGPFYKAKFTTELAGGTARTVIHSTAPVFYLHFSDGAGEDGGPSMIAGWAIVHVLVDKDRRLLSTVKFTQFTGKAKRNDSQVEVTVTELPNGWTSITPKTPLDNGEYALLPVMRQENAFSTSVYDFKVDPTADNAPDAIAASQN